MKIRFKIFSCLVFLSFTLVQGALGYPLPVWEYLESEHFQLAYTKDTVHYVEESLRIAEKTYVRLTDYFGYPAGKKKIELVLRDDYDYSNGFADSKEQHVEIYCRNVPFLYRQFDADWLENVISHELSHIYSLRRFEPFFNMVLGLDVYEKNLNAGLDGLFIYGYARLPLWFIEGAAQLGSELYGADFPDAYREMLLKDAYLHDRLLSLDAMCRFEGSSKDRELVYNQGFDFVRYLDRQYKEKSFRELCRHIALSGFAKAFPAVYGQSLETLHRQWLDDLSVRYTSSSVREPGRRMFDRNQLLNLEVASAAGGKYVIANWGNDVQRYNLFVRRANGSYRRLADSVGMILKQDRISHTVWFTRQEYNRDTDTATFDIYRILPGEKLERQTNGCRVMAFDVLDDQVYYAAYNSGLTEIRLRSRDGSEVLLHTFQPGTSVYSLTVLSQQQVLCELGEMRGLLLLSSGKQEVLWPEYKISDPVTPDGRTLYFISTFEGSPQLYRTTLEHPESWIRLTSSAGIRFPAAEWEDGQASLSCSVYTDGSFLRYVFESRDSAQESIAVNPGSGLVPERGLPQLVEPEVEVATPFFITAPALILVISLDGDLLNPGGDKSLAFTSGFQLGMRNLPASFMLNTWINLSFPFFLSTPESLFTFYKLALGVDAAWELGYFENSISYQLFGDYYVAPVSAMPESLQVFDYDSQFQPIPGFLTTTLGYNQQVYSRLFYDDTLERNYSVKNDYITLSLDNSLSISAYQSLNLDYTLFQLNYRVSGIREMIERSHYLEGGWSYFRTPYNVFDPAELGQGYYQASLNFRQQWASAPVVNSEDQLTGYFVPRQASRVRGSLEGRVNLASRRLSLQGRLSGFTYFYPASDENWMRDSFPGLQSDFSGYPYNYAAMRDLIQLTATLRLNPFVTYQNATGWYERFYLRLTVETGLLNHFNDGGYALDYPLALTAAYHQQIYFNPASPATLMVSFATPLNHFLEPIEEPCSFQVSFTY